MFDEKEIKLPVASTESTVGLVSAMQLLNTTPGEIFIIVRDDTSEEETQRIIYPSMEFPKQE
jgi:hypothetical protein